MTMFGEEEKALAITEGRIDKNGILTLESMGVIQSARTRKIIIGRKNGKNCILRN